MTARGPGPRPEAVPFPPRRCAGSVLALLLGFVAGAAAAAPTVRVEVEGVDASLAQAAIEASGVRELDCAAAPWAVRFRAGRLESALRERLRDRARLAPAIEHDQARTEECWRLRMEVDPGVLTRLRDVRIEIDGPGREEVLPVLERHRLEAGAPLDEGAYEALKRALLDRALARGHLSATFAEHRIDVWPEEGVADVTLRLALGPVHRFDDLRLTVTPDRLDPALVERVLGWSPGARWSRETIGEVRRRLLASGYVDTVDLRSRPSEDGTVALDADVRLQPRHRISGGVGFATDIGPRAEIGYDNRYVNRLGHQAGAELRASPVRSSLRSEYRLPLDGANDPWLHLEAGITAERTDTVESDAATASVRRVHAGPFGTRAAEFLELSRERFDVALDESTARLAIVGLAWERSERSALEPLELGWQFSTSIRGTSTPVSTTDLLQLRASGEVALRAGDRGRVILRADTGTTWTPSIAKLPASLRFFAGGDRSIRGYGLDDVGPLAVNGEVRGGRHLLVGSIEFERVVRGRWSAAVFADSGGAFNDADAPWVTGVGAGVRWRSPIGPVRVDLAVPLDDPTRQLRLHFGIGTQFR